MISPGAIPARCAATSSNTCFMRRPSEVLLWVNPKSCFIACRFLSNGVSTASPLSEVPLGLVNVNWMPTLLSNDLIGNSLVDRIMRWKKSCRSNPETSSAICSTPFSGTPLFFLP